MTMSPLMPSTLPPTGIADQPVCNGLLADLQEEFDEPSKGFLVSRFGTSSVR